MATFYAARSEIITPLPWPTFALPFSNAVFVKTLKDVGAVLDVFLAAAQAGELDSVLAQAAERKPRIKPGTARAAQDG